MKNRLSRKKMKKALRRAAPASVPIALGLGAAIGALAATFGRAPIGAFVERARAWVAARGATEAPRRANGVGRPIANPIASGL